MKVEGEITRCQMLMKNTCAKWVIPMRQELVRSGFEELTTEEAVTEFMEIHQVQL